ncbi:MAG: DNA polymerase III subunit delta' [Betaproteobacteria bacterium]|nr:MAG: DNA polymerase III subunit delta' [Betaproteobacteria bacterium]
MRPTRYAWHADAWRHAQSALRRGAHALLIAGASGLGKGEFALNLAASYLCANTDPQEGACGACESCHWLAAGTHPDFVLVERPSDDDGAERGASVTASARERPIGVDQIRALAPMLSVSAHRDAGKVVVIRPAEALNLSASNALLKSLEEPPSGVVFLLVANRPALLPPTVRSRCQAITIPLQHEAAAAWLEGQGIDDPALRLALAGGAPLEAVSIAAEPMWGKRQGFLNALAQSGFEPITIAEAYRDLPPPLVLSWLQKWTYDLIVMRYCARARYHVDLQPAIRAAAACLDPVRVTRLYRTLLAFQRHVNHPLNPRLFIEQMLIEYARAVEGGGG